MIESFIPIFLSSYKNVSVIRTVASSFSLDWLIDKSTKRCSSDPDITMYCDASRKYAEKLSRECHTVSKNGWQLTDLYWHDTYRHVTYCFLNTVPQLEPVCLWPLSDLGVMKRKATCQALQRLSANHAVCQWPLWPLHHSYIIRGS